MPLDRWFCVPTFRWVCVYQCLHTVVNGRANINVALTESRMRAPNLAAGESAVQACARYVHARGHALRSEIDKGLLVTKRVHRRDARGPPCREESGRENHRDENDGRGSNHDRVVAREAV